MFNNFFYRLLSELRPIESREGRNLIFLEGTLGLQIFFWVLVTSLNPTKCENFQLTKNPNELYKNLRILMEVQFIYSSIYVLNPITVFWLNPNHGPTIRDFFLTLFEAVGLYVQDEDSTDYRWRWQKKSVIPLLINDLERVDTNDSVKLINLEEFE